MSRGRLGMGALALLACALLPRAGAAQSPFAVRNVGQRLATGDARMEGRGGWGQAVLDSLQPGFANPASTAQVRHVVFRLTAYGETGDHASATDTRTTHRVTTPGIQVAIPVDKGRLAFTTGFRLERSSHWSSQVDSTWYAWSDTIGGNVSFDREGTMFKVPLGLAWQPKSWLAVGAAVNLESGSLRESLANSYITPAGSSGVPYYSANLRVDEDRYSGTSFSLGAVAEPVPGLSLGVSWTSAHDLTVERKIEQGVAQRAYETFDLSLPAELKAGFQARLDERWQVGGDARFAKFTDLAGRADWKAESEDETCFAFGFERRRADVRHGGWGNRPLRVGASWQRWAYRVGGEPVHERTLSVGTGFPFRGDSGQLDVALSYAVIGNEADNGFDSKVWRLTFSVTGLEAWW